MGQKHWESFIQHGKKLDMNRESALTSLEAKQSSIERDMLQIDLTVKVSLGVTSHVPSGKFPLVS